jgi:DivIVA domain-containing protein
MSHTSDLPLPAEFTQVQFREGYATAEVDAFVARAMESVRAATPTMRPTEVAAVRFTPVRLRSGYDMREVDTWLDVLEQHLTTRLPDAAEEDAAATPTRRWSVRGMIPVLVIVLGGLVGLLAGLWPGGPTARETTVIGLVAAAALLGLGIIVVQLVMSVLAVVAGAVRVVRRLTDRTA